MIKVQYTKSVTEWVILFATYVGKNYVSPKKLECLLKLNKVSETFNNFAFTSSS